MSSGFVSGGTIDDPAERDDAWRAAQQEIEEKRRQKEDEVHQNDGKSLFEVLQANKAAKQEAFEEAARLKNQYRALDDSEAEFLDSVLEGKRKEEEAVRKETMLKLDLFRRQREEAEQRALEEENAGTPSVEDAQWIASGRKRKKGHEGGLLKGVKLKKSRSTTEEEVVVDARQAVGPVAKSDHGEDNATGVSVAQSAKATAAASPTPHVANPISLGLGYASSDEDD